MKSCGEKLTEMRARIWKNGTGLDTRWKRGDIIAKQVLQWTMSDKGKEGDQTMLGRGLRKQM